MATNASYVMAESDLLIAVPTDDASVEQTIFSSFQQTSKNFTSGNLQVIILADLLFKMLCITQACQILSFIFWMRVAFLMYWRCLVLSFDLSFNLLILVTGKKGDLEDIWHSILIADGGSAALSEWAIADGPVLSLVQFGSQAHISVRSTWLFPNTISIFTSCRIDNIWDLCGCSVEWKK